KVPPQFLVQEESTHHETIDLSVYARFVVRGGGAGRNPNIHSYGSCGTRTQSTQRESPAPTVERNWHGSNYVGHYDKYDDSYDDSKCGFQWIDHEYHRCAYSLLRQPAE